MGVLLVFHAGGHNTLSVFTTKYTPPGFHGLSGVVAGSVFSILAFGGFEGAAPLAEEARNPGRTVQLAVLLATLLIGALYVFTTYAADVAFGPSRIRRLHYGHRQRLVGGLGQVVLRPVLDPGLPRDRQLHAGKLERRSERVQPDRVRHGPDQGVSVAVRPGQRQAPGTRQRDLLGTVISLAAMLGLGLHYGPTEAFAMVGTALVILLVAIYIVMNAACIGFFARSPHHRFNVVSHLVIPVLGIAAFVPAWCAGAGHQDRRDSWISPLPAPLSYMGPAVAVWMAIGVVYLIYLYVRDPQRVIDVGLIHLDAAPAETAAQR